jgi:gluconate kinase
VLTIRYFKHGVTDSKRRILKVSDKHSLSHHHTNMSIDIEKQEVTSYVVILSGTHVTGKETLAIALSKSMNCPWLKAEMACKSANISARSQTGKGYSYDSVFGRIWFTKLLRLGLLSDGYESDGGSNVDSLKKPAPRKNGCIAVISSYAMRKPARDAIRNVMISNGIRPIHAIMHVTKETLSGRTLGAEEPELAERIMGEKIADIQRPLEEEKDVLMIDSLRVVDEMFSEIMMRTSELIAISMSSR